MLHIKEFVFSLIVLLYSIAIGFYTTYGLSKSYTEYFCIQRRPDTVDYRSNLQANWLHHNIDGHDDVYIMYKGSFNKLDCNSFCNSTMCDTVCKEGLSVGRTLNVNFMKKSEYFNLTCTWSVDRFGDMGNTLHAGIRFDSSGYIESSDMILKPTFAKTEDLSNFWCYLEKSPETCEIRKETSDTFLKLFLALATFVSLAFSATRLKYRSYLFLRIAYRMQEAIRGMKTEIRFCNPITNSPIYINKGEVCFVMGKNFQHLDAEQELQHFSDKSGNYICVGESSVISIMGAERRVFNLSPECFSSLKKYFYISTVDPRRCIVDNDFKHYISTIDVLSKLENGEFINTSVCPESSFALDVSRLDINLVKASFQMKDEVAIFLIEHNKSFFNSFKPKALFLCLRSKMKFWDRPDGVGNSQWKLYTSDFCQYMNNKLKSTYKSQVKLGGSRALKYVESLEKIKVEESDKNITIGVREPEINVSDICSSLEYSLNKSRDKFLKVSSRYFSGSSTPISKEDIAYSEHCKNMNSLAFSFGLDCETKGKTNVSNKEQLRERCRLLREKGISRFAEFRDTALTYKDALCKEGEVKLDKGILLEIEKEKRNMETIRVNCKKGEVKKGMLMDASMDKIMGLERKLEAKKLGGGVSRFRAGKKFYEESINFCLKNVKFFDDLLEKLDEYEREKENELPNIEFIETSTKQAYEKILKSAKKNTKSKKKNKGKKTKSRNKPPSIVPLKGWAVVDPANLLDGVVELSTNGFVKEPKMKKRSYYNSMAVIVNHFKKSDAWRSSAGKGEKKNESCADRLINFIASINDRNEGKGVYGENFELIKDDHLKSIMDSLSWMF